MYATVIDNMTSAKYNSALLITEMMNTMKLSIQPIAIQGAMHDIDYGRMLINKSNIGGKNMLDKLLATFNNYTIVAYPVSYHYDVFNKGQHCLENKICFSFESKGDGIGRGGGGANEFTFAILDWTNSNASKQRRLQYKIMGGVLSDNQMLTKKRWVAKFGAEWKK